jgi:acetylornithine/N-succinyldiaminopimelate aminotransferase
VSLFERGAGARHPAGGLEKEEKGMDHVLRCSGYELMKSDMVRAEGCTLYDAQGKRFVDLEAGVWCSGLGHNHPRVNEAIQRQLEEIAHIAYRYTTPLIEEAAMAVLETVGLPDGRCVFLSSGSEAVEFAVQVARRLTEQPLHLTLTDSYLAAYGSAGRQSPEEWVRFDWHVCRGCPHEEGCDPECDYLQEIPFERVGGVVFEPGCTGGLVKFPPRQLVEGLARRVRERQGLVLVDEVTTGMGRTGRWYGFEHYGLEPDIVAVGKGLGNGYPVSAVVMTDEVASRLEKGAFHYAQSHQNDPLGCAVAKEVIAVIRDEGLVERSARVGHDFLGKLQRLGERHAVVEDVRGRGLMIAMELAYEAVGQSVYEGLMEAGFLAGWKPAAKVLRFYPPLTVAEEDLARLVGALDAALSETGR